MKTYTISDLRALNPCYDPATKLGESWSGTILDIFDHSLIPDKDKIWAASKILDEKTLRLFSAACAEYAVSKLKITADPRVTAAIKAARDFANGLIDDSARAAAYSASNAARVAYSAAYSAARAAAEASAAYSAAYSEADSAARTAYYAAEAAYYAAEAASTAAYSAAYSEAAYYAADSAARAAYSEAADSAAYSTAVSTLVELVMRLVYPNINPESSNIAGTAGVKHDQEKPDMSLLSSIALTKVSQVMTFGKKKYSANNWRGGIAWTRLLAAALRHIFAYLGGQNKDPETGLSHLAHAVCCLMMLLEFEDTHIALDDRYKATE